MSDYRYQLERYRGRGTRHISPQCHRKQSFTRYYIDTHNNNNEYINNNIGKYYLLDKYGYHYTPKQYFTDNPWLRERLFVCLKHRDFDKQTMPQPQPKAEPTKREFEREEATTTMRVDALFPKRASPNLTGIKNNTRVVVG